MLLGMRDKTLSAIRARASLRYSRRSFVEIERE